MYQPMSGLHRPVVVDPTLANFQDLRLTVSCAAEGLLNAQDASALCQKVGTLFENQGAVVTLAGELDDPAARPSADLQVDLRARQIHAADHPLSWALCIASFTVLPGVTEATFAQEVVIRDGTGFLLGSEALEGRIVNRFGVGTWLGNTLLDLTRDEADRLGGDRFDEDVSSDLYRQLSQILFNAEMRRQILQQSTPVNPEAM